MRIKKSVKYDRKLESVEEKIKEGLKLTYKQRQELCLSLSFHVLKVLKVQGIEPFEEKSNIPRSYQIIKLPQNKK